LGLGLAADAPALCLDCWDNLVEIDRPFLVMTTASLPQPELAALLYWSPG
jgi:hypothetical protein